MTTKASKVNIKYNYPSSYNRNKEDHSTHTKPNSTFYHPTYILYR